MPGIAYLLLALTTALLLSREGCRTPLPADPDTGTDWLLDAWLSLSLAFLGPFLALGVFEIVTGWAVVSSTAASAVLLPVVLILVVRHHGRRGNATFLLLDCWRQLAVVARHWRPASRTEWLVVAVVLFVVVPAALLRPADFPRGYETFAYVFPAGVALFETGSFRPAAQSFPFAYPAAYSVYAGFFLQNIPERACSLLNLPFAVPLLVSVAALARWAGADARASRLAAWGLLSVPIVGNYVFTPFPDLPGLAYLSTGLYFGLSQGDGSARRPLRAGLAFGLAYGCKMIHLIPACFLFAVLALRQTTALHGRRRRWALTSSGAFGAAFLAVAGFWLLRNLWAFGNPLYPVNLPVPGALPGLPAAPDIDLLNRVRTQYEWVRSSAEWLVYPWVEWHYKNQNLKTSSGLGLFFAAFLPATLAFSSATVVYGLLHRRAGRALRVDSSLHTWSRLALLLTGLFLTLAAWWQLGDRQPRYAVGALAFYAPLCAWTLTQVKGPRRARIDALAAVCCSIMLVVMAVQQVAFLGKRLTGNDTNQRHAVLGYVRALDDLAPGAVVLNLANRPHNFQLLGRWHRNRVIDFMDTVALMSPGLAPSLRLEAQAQRVPDLSLCTPSVLLRRPTHLYTYSNVRFAYRRCASVTEVARKNQEAQDSPVPVLYAVTFHDSLTGQGVASAR